MDAESEPLNTFIDSSLRDSQESGTTLNIQLEPFLHFDPNSELSFDDKSTIYSSLVALVKADHTFDNVLQDRATTFLKSIKPDGREPPGHANKLVTDLVPSSDGSRSGFVDSIIVLLSSPHSMLRAAALSFVFETTTRSSPTSQCRLVESDLVSKVLATVQPHTLSISGNETIFDSLIRIINTILFLAFQTSLQHFGKIAAVGQFNHREMIFQKVVLPSSQFVTFLISNRYLLNEHLLDSFTILLGAFIRICPFHRPTLEFVLTSPIMMAISSCLSFIEDDSFKWNHFTHINYALKEWKRAGPEVSQSGIRMMQALISEGFEDTLEQITMIDKYGYFVLGVVEECQPISQLLGSNVEITEW